MIVLLGCSISSLANDNLHSSTGQLKEDNDSVLIAYDDLRIANSKLIELEYQKEINDKLKGVIRNDSIIISEYGKINNRIKQDCDKTVKQRNIAIGVSIVAILTAFFVTIGK